LSWGSRKKATKTGRTIAGLTINNDGEPSAAETELKRGTV